MFLAHVKTLYKPLVLRKQNLFHWLNIVFNKVDEERRKEVGPDRCCAEWLLRNGAYVKWSNSTEFLMDYNKLPGDNTKLHIMEVDATEASIMHYGFEHFVGCNHIRKITFHKCYYLENEALKSLAPLKKCLRFLQITECLNITGKGLTHLGTLSNLQELILSDLPYVKDKLEIVNKLQNDLPECNIQFN